MNRDEAMRIYELLLNDWPEEKSSVESKIRAGVCRMLAAMWRVYWQACFEGRQNKVIKPSAELGPLEAARKLWLDFVENERSRWVLKRDKLEKYGRKDDAVKESTKLDQLDRLVVIWKRESGVSS